MSINIKNVLAEHAKWLKGDGGERANLEGANLKGASLVDANLRGASLVDAELEGAILKGASLVDANLEGANLEGASLVDAILVDAKLVDAKLDDADLRGADLRGASLEGADLDFSCWPLWCGSLKVKVDKRIAVQLLYHAISVMQGVDDTECRRVSHLKSVVALCNKFHRIPEVERLETEVKK